MEWCQSRLNKAAKVLDVGCGSGYLCASFYEMVKDDSKNTNVVGIEHIQELCDLSLKNLEKSYSQEL